MDCGPTVGSGAAGVDDMSDGETRDEEEEGIEEFSESEIRNPDVKDSNRILFVHGFGYACVLPPSKGNTQMKVRSALDYIAHTFPGDFTLPPFANVDVNYLTELIYCGYLPMMHVIMNQEWMTPKIHRNRCMIMLQSGDLHVSKNVKKKGKKYRLTIDTAFDEIIRRCHAYHDSCWLRKPLVDAFRKLHVALPSCFPIQEDKPNAKDKTIHKHTHTQTHTQTPQNPSPDRMDINTAQINSRDKIRVRTIELWDKNGEHLVAGEIGYTLGRTYTSLSGFTCESGSGTVQCIALGRLLERCGYTYWDLGMSMAYKLSMGAKNLPRLKFLDRLAEERDKEPEKSITCMLGTKANDIIAK